MPELTYSGLQAAAKELAADVARSSEAIRQNAKLIDGEATATARDAESIAALHVDKASIGEARELANIMRGLSEATIAHASAAETTSRRAQAVHDQNRASHSGMNESVNRSPVGSEIYDVDRRWVMQE